MANTYRFRGLLFSFTLRGTLAISTLMALTLQQFNELQERVRNPRRAPAAAVAETFSSASLHQVLLGLDPSLRGTGYGIIRLGKPGPRALAHGTISCPAGWERSRCLAKISQTLR